MAQKARVRFAPSPTGNLHIGGVRTAIFNWLYARHHGGDYLLRIEDTDLERSTDEYLQSQLRSLAWMGLMPDEDPVYQMQRSKHHQEQAKKFMLDGLAYPCFCEPRDADAVVAQLARGEVNKYSGTCREQAWTEQDLKKPYSVRFKLPNGCKEVVFDDEIRGSVRVPDDQLDDMVIMRRDGSATYNFCVVLDDIAMGITQVIRGEDHLTNTAKQLLFYQALGVQPPKFAHLPLILGKAGNKLSKRDAAVSVEQYREQGFMADALFNYLVRLGWAHGDQEVFSKDELQEKFTLNAVGKKGAIFDTQKLMWLNGVYIRQSSANKLLEAIKQMDEKIYMQLVDAWSESALQGLILQYAQRATTLKELAHAVLHFAHAPQVLDITCIEKWHSDATKPMVSMFAQWLDEQKVLIKETAMEAAKKIVAQHDQKLVALAQPLRLALTGSLQSPSVFDLIVCLGKKETKHRLDALLEKM